MIVVTMSFICSGGMHVRSHVCAQARLGVKGKEEWDITNFRIHSE